MEVEREEKTGNVSLSLDELLEILGNSTRRVILAKLSKVPHSASELAKALDISRQAVHSQLKILNDSGLIENIGPDLRGGSYRIKSNIGVHIDITPDYYNVNYNFSKIDLISGIPNLKDMGCHVDYNKIKKPNAKLKFLSEKIRDIENEIRKLEQQRAIHLQNKECLIIELKNIISQFDDQLIEKQKNKEKEIIYTLLYNPLKFFKNKRLNIDKLIDEMLFSNIDVFERNTQRDSVNRLLKHMSNFMDIFREDEDDWIFDI